MRLSPEVNLLAFTHYLQALEYQRKALQVESGSNITPQKFSIACRAFSPMSPGGYWVSRPSISTFRFLLSFSAKLKLAGPVPWFFPSPAAGVLWLAARYGTVSATSDQRGGSRTWPHSQLDSLRGLQLRHGAFTCRGLDRSERKHIVRWLPGCNSVAVPFICKIALILTPGARTTPYFFVINVLQEPTPFQWILSGSYYSLKCLLKYN
jgi:hypothetical protein